MLRKRIIPTLLLRNDSLVKTYRFGSFGYIGDPANTCRIFNELEVDELLFLDIMASSEYRSPNFKVLADIADECFMPLGYGGGITCLDDAKKVFSLGFEKISLNTQAYQNPSLISDIASQYGSQAVIASIDVKKNFFGSQYVYTSSGRFNTRLDPVKWALQLEEFGAGEILLTSIDREGTWSGFDIDLVKRVSEAVSVPVIAHGGCGTVSHIDDVINTANASAVALGSMVVYQKKGMGVLVNFPDQYKLNRIVC